MAACFATLPAVQHSHTSKLHKMGMASLPPVMISPSSIGSVLRPDLARQACRLIRQLAVLLPA